jgi:tetratricopeptide (TPR) repeat protein
MNVRRVIIVGLLGVTLAGGSGLIWRTARIHAMAVAGIPPCPDLAGRPAVLRERLLLAEQAARSIFHGMDGLAELSRLYHANGLFGEAAFCYDALQRVQPRDPRWPHLQASLLSGRGQLDEALPLEQRAVAMAPTYLPARLRLGDIQLKSNRTTAAAASYATALAREPGNPYALIGLAKCDLKERHWRQAQDRLQEAVRLHPDFIGALSLLVTVAEHFGDEARAASLRDKIGRREFSDLPDPWLDDLMEDCYDPYRLSVASAVAKYSGNPVLARHLLERATALEPDNGSYHRQLGQLLTLMADRGSARRELERAVEVSPEDNDAWLSLYQLLNKDNAAGAAADRVLAAGLSHCPQSYGLHLESARRLKAAGRREEAIAEFRTAHRLQPSEAGPLIELARVLFAVNQGGEAVAALQEALAKQPENPAALSALMFYYISAGDERRALHWWDHVRRQSRTPPHIVNTLTQTFQQQFGHAPPEAN